MRDRPRIRGISLVECLVAVVVLSIGLVTVIQCLNAALIYNNRANRVAIATARAVALVQEVRSFSVDQYKQYKTAQNGTGGVVVTTSGTTMTVTQPTTIPRVLTNGTETITLAQYTGDATINSKVYQVTVDVAWTGVRKLTEHYVLVTCISNRTDQ